MTLFLTICLLCLDFGLCDCNAVEKFPIIGVETFLVFKPELPPAFGTVALRLISLQLQKKKKSTFFFKIKTNAVVSHNVSFCMFQ